MFDIQSRWVLDGNILRYYGLRNRPNLLKNEVKLSKKQVEIVKKLPCQLTDKEINLIKNYDELIKDFEIIKLPHPTTSYHII